MSSGILQKYEIYLDLLRFMKKKFDPNRPTLIYVNLNTFKWILHFIDREFYDRILSNFEELHPFNFLWNISKIFLNVDLTK